MPDRTLIVVPEQHGVPHALALMIARRMRAKGRHRVDICDAIGGGAPPPQGYDAVLFGARATRHRDRRLLGDYIAGHRSFLERMPTALFLSYDWRTRRPDPKRFIDAFESDVGWQARFAAALFDGTFSIARLLARSVLLAALRTVDGAAAHASVPEVTALADAVTHELARHRS